MNSRSAGGAVLLAAAATACSAAPSSLAAGRVTVIEQAAAHYRARHDLDSLYQVVAGLRIGESREEVERVLGEPSYCPVDGEQCYYHSTATNRAGVALMLTVEYRVFDATSGELRATGVLEAFRIGPVGE